MQNSNQIVKINPDKIKQLEKLARQGFNAMGLTSKIESAATVGSVIAQMKNAMTPEFMQPIQGLMNSSLGFKTDKNSNQKDKYGKPVVPYHPETIKSCLIEALLYGVQPVGNQFNIISGQCYITKEGFGYLLRKVPGLKYTITPGIPKMKDGGALIEMDIEWELQQGEKHSKVLPLAIKINSFMGSDAIVGKATRKARKYLYEIVANTYVPEGDVTDRELDKTPIKNVTPAKENNTYSASEKLNDAFEI